MEMRRIWSLIVIAILVLVAFGCKPSITSTSPPSPITLRANQSKVFTVTATGGNLTYVWELDGVTQASTTNTFTYTPTSANLGHHTLKVTVSNAEGQASYTWDIMVTLIEYKWEKIFGGSGDDVAYSIQQTADGGYIVAGKSNSTNIAGATNHGGYDCYVLKLNAAGNFQWQVLYGGSGDDIARSIQCTADGGYIVAGYSDSTNIPGVTNSGGKDFYVLKLSAAGVVQWQAMYGGTGNDYAYSIQTTQGGGYIMAGYTSPSLLLADIHMIKLNADGTVSLDMLYDTGTLEFAYSIKETVNNLGNADGYILAGSKNALAFYVIRTDLSGAILWEDSSSFPIIGGAAWDVVQAADGGFVVTGWVNSFAGSGNAKPDACTIKYQDPIGSKSWSTLSGGEAIDEARSLAEIPGGLGFILTGKTFSDDIRGGSGPPSVGDSDVYLAVFDASGTCVYQERHGGIDLDDQGLSIIITDSGGNPDGFVIVGQKGFLSHDVRVLRYNMF